MAGSNLPSRTTLGGIISGVQTGQTRAARSPVASYSKVQGGAFQVADPNGAIRVSSGSYTYTSGPWKGKTIDSVVTFDLIGNPLLVQGQQPDGSYGFGVYNQMGVKVAFLGAAGLTNYDSTGNPRSIAGLLPSGDYGLAVYPIGGGAAQEVLPLTSGFVADNASTTSSTYVAVGGPGLSVAVGSSGRALVTCSATLASTVPQQTVKAAVLIDGATAVSEIAQSVSGSGSETMQATVSTSQVATGLTPGTHTFEFVAAVTGGVPADSTANYTNMGVVVQPL